MGLLGVLEMDDAEEQRIFGRVQQHESRALQIQLTPLSLEAINLSLIFLYCLFISYFCDVAEKKEVNK